MLLHNHDKEDYANMVSPFHTGQRVSVVQPIGTGRMTEERDTWFRVALNLKSDK